MLIMPEQVTWGKTFSRGGKAVRYGYYKGKRIGLFLVKGATLVKKAQYYYLFARDYPTAAKTYAALKVAKIVYKRLR